MRRIRDEHNVEWTIYKVERTVRPMGKRAEDLLPANYVNGWLVFQSVTGKRRLAPYPPNWDSLPDATLRSLLAAATPARPSGSVIEPGVQAALRDVEYRPEDDS
jgi:hypothetical protein